MELTINPNGPIPEYNPGLGRCWIWGGRKHSGGYGAISILGKEHYAHRVSYILFSGHIPQGMVLDHLCRVRECVNPRHLDPVTIGENIKRGLGHGKEKECPKGHAYSEDNTYIRKDVYGRMCKKCNTDANRRRKRIQ